MISNLLNKERRDSRKALWWISVFLSGIMTRVSSQLNIHVLIIKSIVILDLEVISSILIK